MGLAEWAREAVARNRSQSAFCLPPSSSVILWIKIANTATDSDGQLLANTDIQAQACGVSRFGQFVQAWMEDNRTINPIATFVHNYAGNPYDLAAAGPNGPTVTSSAIKLGASSKRGSGSASFGHPDASWLTFIGFYYLYGGQPQGQTIPFMDFVTNSPNCVS